MNINNYLDRYSTNVFGKGSKSGDDKRLICSTVLEWDRAAMPA